MKNGRDARMALASLTPAGDKLFSDATGVVRDAMEDVFEHTPSLTQGRPQLLTMLGEACARLNASGVE